MLRGPVAWVCRGALVASPARYVRFRCPGLHRAAAIMRRCLLLAHWDRDDPVAGTAARWLRRYNDARGTEPTAGEPYAAIGRPGRRVRPRECGLCLRRKAGQPALDRAASWSLRRADRFRPRLAGVVTVGVATVAGTQWEVVLSAATGRLIRAFPRAPFGGTAAADSRHTVVVGPGAVTSYDNASGRAIWTQQTGAAPQRWQLDGHVLYVSVAAGGFLAAQPVTALRRIDLRSGAERVIRPRSGSFAGTPGAALDGVVLFGGATGVTAYSGSTGTRLWQLPGAAPQAIDVVTQLFYLTAGSGLEGVDPGGNVRSRLLGTSAFYGERDGVAFGLDDGASGDAWGLDTTTQHVIWTTSSLSWPHVFIDLSGLGGSADPRSSAIIVAACAQANVNVSPAQCVRPELVAISR